MRRSPRLIYYFLTPSLLFRKWPWRFLTFFRGTVNGRENRLLHKWRRRRNCNVRCGFLKKKWKGKTMSLSNLASSASLRFLKSLWIKSAFLDLSTEQWEQNEGFQEGRKIEKLKVVNDEVERGVAIISTFSYSLTRDEDTKQVLLQVVEHHRRLHPLKWDFLNCVTMWHADIQTAFIWTLDTLYWTLWTVNWTLTSAAVQTQQ